LAVWFAMAEYVLFQSTTFFSICEIYFGPDFCELNSVLWW
jgi:hypothetical protein